MKIYNFNHPTRPHVQWHYHQYWRYVRQLRCQVQSLYDYIINFNPPYNVINRENNPDKISNLLTDDNVNKYYGNNTEGIYYANKLLFHQGFINTGIDARLRYNNNGDTTDFPSGYICICNTSQKESRTLNDYIILPASVPSLYWFSWQDDNWVAQYHDNTIGNRVDQIIFTLPSEPCRFNYKNIAWGANPTGFSANSSTVTTVDGLYWTDEPLQIHHYLSIGEEGSIIGTEELFIDSTSKTMTVYDTIDGIKTFQQQLVVDNLSPMARNLIYTKVI